MNSILWGLQFLLALLFLLAGILKVTQPVQQLATRMTWIPDFAAWQVRVIGMLEILGAVGILIPALIGVAPWLTPLAALGLALTMIGAVLVHLRRAEWFNIGVNVIILALALLVAYGRFVAVPL